MNCCEACACKRPPSGRDLDWMLHGRTLLCPLCKRPQVGDAELLAVLAPLAMVRQVRVVGGAHGRYH